jgi:hypothetical protein
MLSSHHEQGYVMTGNARDTVTLLDVLIDGFEKNEVLYGYHWRELPMPDEAAAVRQFGLLTEEARRWKGEPTRIAQGFERQVVTWSDLEIRQAGRAVMVRVKAPRFSTWWHAPATWAGDPTRAIREWIEEEAGGNADA